MEVFKLKLDRSIWLSLLGQDKLLEAYESFNIYFNNLLKHKRKNGIKEEIDLCQKIFYTALFEKNKKYIEQENYNQALIASNILFKIDNLHIDSIKLYLKALAKTNQKDLCKDMIAYLKTITNDDKDFYKYFANIFNEIKDYENAIKYLEDYINFKPKEEILADDYNWLGCYYTYLYNVNFELSDLEKSIELFLCAYKIDSWNKLYLKNLAVMTKVKKDKKTARKYWNEILAKFTLSNDDKWEYMTFCLEEGNFEEYFKYINSRFIKSEKVYFPKLSGKKWNGIENISDSTLLIYCIQGYGDTILYSGYLPRLKNMAKKIIYLVQDSLLPLFCNNNYDIEVLPISDTDVISLQYDYYIPSTDVLKVLQVNRNTLSVDTDFIKLDNEEIEKVRKLYFNNDKLKIGLSCYGSKLNSKERNLQLDKLVCFDDINNAEFYILNKEFDDKHLPQNTKNRFINLGKTFNNFKDTAIAIKNCDLIISTDNNILNLAGILDKKTYGLFNWRAEFRWFDLTGEDVIWYKSVKPFVNEKMNDWSSSINKVVDLINNGNK